MATMLKTHNEEMIDLLKQKLNVVVSYADKKEKEYHGRSYLSVNLPKKVLNLKSKKY